MEFIEIKADMKNLDFDMTRNDSDDYFEAVIKKSNLAKLVEVLEKKFGLPAWPSRNKLSKDIEMIVKKFGGLRNGQTLYFLMKEGRSLFAMLWPWQDNERVTVKIGRVKK